MVNTLLSGPKASVKPVGPILHVGSIVYLTPQILLNSSSTQNTNVVRRSLFQHYWNVSILVTI